MAYFFLSWYQNLCKKCKFYSKNLLQFDVDFICMHGRNEVIVVITNKKTF